MISRAIGRPRPVPPGRVEPANASNRWACAAVGTPLPVSATSMTIRSLLPPGVDRDQAAAVVGERLIGIAREVQEHPEQLIAIGADRRVGADLVAPAHRSRLGAEQGLADLVDQRAQGEPGPARRAGMGAREAQGLAAQLGRPIHRLDQPRRDPPDVGVLALIEPVGEKHRAGQEVAQIVVDLADRGAERGETGLLRERGAQVLLHPAELVLHQADLVAAPRDRQVDAGILRPVAKRDHALRDPPQRPHDDELQRRIDQERREQRDDDREVQDPPGIVDHGAPHRLLAQADVDQHLRALGRGADHADHPLAAIPERAERVADHGARARRRADRTPCAPAAACPASARPTARARSRTARPRGRAARSRARCRSRPLRPPRARGWRDARPRSAPPDRPDESARSRGRRSAPRPTARTRWSAPAGAPRGSGAGPAGEAGSPCGCYRGEIAT